jgi:Na+/proline symporter
VQRYLSAKSVGAARQSLLMSAYWKIPLQALVLLVGVGLFAFYLFTPPPMLFNPVHEAELRAGAHAAEYAGLEQEYAKAVEARGSAARTLAHARQAGEAAEDEAAWVFRQRETETQTVREKAVALVRLSTGDAAFNDANFVFPTFILTKMPVGLVGLLIAAILAAAMSTISSELASLSTTTVIDFYRRLIRPDGTDAHLLMVSRVATVGWGVFAAVVAVYAAELGSLIEVVNRFGSFFYGSILGVFILAIGFKRANGHGAFVGLLAGMGSVAWVATYTPVAFLWHNVVGAVVVVAVGLLVSLFAPSSDTVVSV